MKKKILILISFVFLLFPVLLQFGVLAKTNDNISLLLEQQESSDMENVRYILTMQNVDSLSDITNISADLFLYKYGETAKKTSYDIKKVYESVSGTNGKSKEDNTYYAVLTLTNVKTNFDGYTLTCQMNVTTNDNRLESNPISYTINETIDNSKIISMDASAVPSLEAAGVKYYDFNGKEEDVFRVLADNGFNYIRVRVWNDPYYTDSNGIKHGYGGGNCDIENCLAIGRRANKYGMKLLVDFQYSDFWTDPGKQKLPKAWAGYSDSQITSAISAFTTESLNYLKNNGIEVGMVQVGNETNDTLCGHSGDSTMEAICNFFNAGSAAVRSVYPNALVAVHFANPSNTSTYNWYAAQLSKYNVDYDVFGSSYYPYWHGTMENMATLLSNIASTYNKKIMLLETSYANCELEGTEANSDGYGNTVYTKEYVEEKYGSSADLGYPFTVEGQANQMLELFEKVFTNIKNGIGVSYWEGTWISVNKTSSSSISEKVSANSPYWEEYGCGWRSSYATSYDSTTYPTEETGGCVIENEAFFDENGNPYESLKAFKTIRDTNYSSTTTTGEIQNGDFETLDSEGYVDFSYFGIDMAEGGTYSSSTKASRSSSHSLNFYGESANTCNFTISQNVSGIDGNYTFSGYVMGGAYTNSTIKAYVTINGETTYGDNVYMTGWSDSSSGFVEASVTFTVSSSDTVYVGIMVNCPDAGAWGYLDDLTLTKNSTQTVELHNGDFETGDYSNWTINCTDSTSLGVVTDSYMKNNTTNFLKFYQSGSSSEFSIFQDVSGISGSYTLSFMVEGMEVSTYTIYAYVTINGTTSHTETITSLTDWDNWITKSMTFNVSSTDTVIVGIYLKTTSSGAWGGIDNITLTAN